MIPQVGSTQSAHVATCRRVFETVFVPVVGTGAGCFRAAVIFGDSASFKKKAPVLADMLITQVRHWREGGEGYGPGGEGRGGGGKTRP